MKKAKTLRGKGIHVYCLLKTMLSNRTFFSLQFLIRFRNGFGQLSLKVLQMAAFPNKNKQKDGNLFLSCDTIKRNTEERIFKTLLRTNYAICGDPEELEGHCGRFVGRLRFTNQKF